MMNENPKLILNDVHDMVDVERESLIKWINCGNVDEVKSIVSTGMNVNIGDSVRNIPLLCAINNEGIYGPKIQLELLEVLFNAGADPNYKFNGSPIFHVSTIRSIDMFEACMKAGANINISDGDGYTVLMTAVRYGNFEMVKTILSYGPYVSIRSCSGWMACHFACRYGQSNIVELLLPLILDINVKADKGLTMLHLATCNGDIDIVKMLMNKGANIDVKTDNLESALELAIMNEHDRITELLSK